MMKNIKEVLMSRGYNEKQAVSVADRLSKIDTSFKEGLFEWIENNTERNYNIAGVELMAIKNKYVMTYPAALLTMDWLLREPEKAKRSINRGVR